MNKPVCFSTDINLSARINLDCVLCISTLPDTAFHRFWSSLIELYSSVSYSQYVTNKTSVRLLFNIEY